MKVIHKLKGLIDNINCKTVMKNIHSESIESLQTMFQLILQTQTQSIVKH